MPASFKVGECRCLIQSSLLVLCCWLLPIALALFYLWQAALGSLCTAWTAHRTVFGAKVTSTAPMTLAWRLIFSIAITTSGEGGEGGFASGGATVIVLAVVVLRGRHDN